MQEEFGAKRKSSLFLASLSSECTEEELFNIFAVYGEIFDIKIMKSNSVNKSLTYGFVNYITVKAATQAKKELNGFVFHGEPLRLGWALTKGGGSSSPRSADVNHKIRTTQVHVSYLSEQTEVLVTHETLRKIFSIYGTVLDVTLVLAKVITKELPNRQCGHGFIHFDITKEGIESAFNAAKSLSKKTVDGVELDCELSHQIRRYLLKGNVLERDTETGEEILSHERLTSLNSFSSLDGIDEQNEDNEHCGGNEEDEASVGTRGSVRTYNSTHQQSRRSVQGYNNRVGGWQQQTQARSPNNGQRQQFQQQPSYQYPVHPQQQQVHAYDGRAAPLTPSPPPQWGVTPPLYYYPQQVVSPTHAQLATQQQAQQPYMPPVDSQQQVAEQVSSHQQQQQQMQQAVSDQQRYLQTQQALLLQQQAMIYQYSPPPVYRATPSHSPQHQQQGQPVIVSPQHAQQTHFTKPQQQQQQYMEAPQLQRPPHLQIPSYPPQQMSLQQQQQQQRVMPQTPPYNQTLQGYYTHFNNTQQQYQIPPTASVDSVDSFSSAVTMEPQYMQPMSVLSPRNITPPPVSSSIQQQLAAIQQQLQFNQLQQMQMHVYNTYPGVYPPNALPPAVVSPAAAYEVNGGMSGQLLSPSPREQQQVLLVATSPPHDSVRSILNGHKHNNNNNNTNNTPNNNNNNGRHPNMRYDPSRSPPHTTNFNTQQQQQQGTPGLGYKRYNPNAVTSPPTTLNRVESSRSVSSIDKTHSNENEVNTSSVTPSSAENEVKKEEKNDYVVIETLAQTLDKIDMK